MYRLRTFGGVSLVGPDGPLEGRVTQRRPLAVLALLATAPGGTLSRDKMTGYLWPRNDPKRARHLLSVTLHAIRRALGGESVLSMGEDLRLNPDLVDVDVRAFEEALEAGRLARAVDLYGGPFLDGFHVREAPAFERWQQGERTRLGRRYAGALETLAERAEADGDVRDALRAWKKLVEHDPYSSRAARRLMQALEWSGDRPEALRVARDHERLVRDELGLEPDPELLDLAERLRNGEEVREDGSRRTAATTPPPPPMSSEDGTAGAPWEPEGTPGSGQLPGGSPSEDEGGSGRRRWSRVRAVVLLSAFLLVGALGFVALEGLGSPKTPPHRDARVLVSHFENRTGDPRLDALSAMATDWITQGLGETRAVEIVQAVPSQRAPRAGEPSGATERNGRQLARARAAGAGLLVRGAVYRDGSEALLHGEVLDVQSGSVVRGFPPIAVEGERARRAVEALRERVTAAVATRLDRRLRPWSGVASWPPSLESYREFVAGLELVDRAGSHGIGAVEGTVPPSRSEDPSVYREALRRFYRASALDSSFSLPLVWALLVHRTLEEYGRADSLAAALDRRRAGLPPLDRHFLDFQKSLIPFPPDRPAALEHLRQLLRIAPRSEYVKFAGHEALLSQRPREAIELLRRLDPRAPGVRNWRQYWHDLGRALHAAGRYGEELELGRRAVRRHPEWTVGYEHQAFALAALGRVDELRSVVERCVATTGADCKAAGSELWYHTGNEEAARRLIRERARRLAGVAPEETNLAHRITRSRMLLWLGETEAARPLVEGIHARLGETYPGIREVTVLTAMEGREEETRELMDRLAGFRTSGATVIRAAAAAHLGDRELALRLLEKARSQWHPYWDRIHTYLELRPLWGDPRFEALVEPPGR